MWLHSGLVLVDGKKMSRSSGNVLTLRDLMKKGFSGRVVRFFLLKTSYKKPIRFSWEALEDAKKALSRLDNFLLEMKDIAHGDKEAKVDISEDIRDLADSARVSFDSAINDDLNMSMALGAIYGMIKGVNTMLSQKKIHAVEADLILKTMGRFNSILNIFDIERDEKEMPPEILRLAHERQKARDEGDWDLADRLREELREKGVEVIDLSGGFKLRPL
jgi:cysteinyl-tRNA synthetase